MNPAIKAPVNAMTSNLRVRNFSKGINRQQKTIEVRQPMSKASMRVSVE